MGFFRFDFQTCYPFVDFISVKLNYFDIFFRFFYCCDYDLNFISFLCLKTVYKAFQFRKYFIIYLILPF